MYKLKFLGKALEDLKRIDRAHQKIIKAKLLILAKNPAALKNNIKKNIITIGIPDKFIEQGNPDLLKKNLGLTSVDIARSVEKFFSRK